MKIFLRFIKNFKFHFYLYLLRIINFWKVCLCVSVCVVEMVHLFYFSLFTSKMHLKVLFYKMGDLLLKIYYNWKFLIFRINTFNTRNFYNVARQKLICKHLHRIGTFLRKYKDCFTLNFKYPMILLRIMRKSCRITSLLWLYQLYWCIRPTIDDCWMSLSLH